jgi:hypothetical protein
LFNNKKIELNIMSDNISNIICSKEMDLTKLSKTELLAKCEELGITKCKSKNKGELIDLINKKQNGNVVSAKESIEFIIDDSEEVIIEVTSNPMSITSSTPINSEYKLVDLFCGTGAFFLKNLIFLQELSLPDS